jgi:uncharacterized membrane protein
MITILRHWWQEMRSSFWFLPAVIVIGAVILATVFIQIDATVDLHFVERWPLFFGAGAAGARGLLAAVASSMITVAGVVFSITIVALSLTSSQYTSRVLRNFMRDTVNQLVLGVFVGIFAYCLVVLRTIRGGDEGAFVPSLAVLTGLLLAFVGIGFLIYFIHHIALSIQAANIIAAVADETLRAVDYLFPKGLGEAPEEEAEYVQTTSTSDEWFSVAAAKTGYVQSADGDSLLALAREHDVIVQMERGIGEFVVAGTPLVSVLSNRAGDDDLASKLNGSYFIGRQRTGQQDAGFGIRQIVDIAIKALSPGVNDSTTAIMCIDYLAAIVTTLATRKIASPFRLDEGELRLIARGPSFVSLLGEALDQIRQNAEGNVAVLTRLVHTLVTIESVTTEPKRRRALQLQAEAILATVERTIPLPQDGEKVRAAVAQLCSKLDASG